MEGVWNVTLEAIDTKKRRSIIVYCEEPDLQVTLVDCFSKNKGIILQRGIMFMLRLEKEP